MKNVKKERKKILKEKTKVFGLAMCWTMMFEDTNLTNRTNKIKKKKESPTKSPSLTRVQQTLLFSIRLINFL